MIDRNSVVALVEQAMAKQRPALRGRAEAYLRWFVPLVPQLMARKHRSLETAEDVLIERASLASVFYQRGLGFRGDDLLRWMASDKVVEQNVRDHCLLTGEVLLDATPYLWIEEMRQAAIASADSLPRHKIEKGTLPQAVMWWTYPDDMSVYDLDGKPVDEAMGMGSNPSLIGSLIHPGMGDEMRVTIQQTDVYMKSDSDEAQAVDGGFCLATQELIRFGDTYPDDCQTDAQRVKAGTLLAMLAFVRSPHLVHLRSEPRRPYRRLMQRNKAPKSMTESVGFTILRHPHAVGYEKPDESQRVNWKYRWLVTGHIRNQPYPSLGISQPIWIAPYVKGPEDAPMKQRVYKVAR